MDDETKKKINKRYKRELNKGERFWPDSIFKDAIVSLGIFILLILLATFIGVAAAAESRPKRYHLYPASRMVFPVPVQVPGDLRADPAAWQDRMDCHGGSSRVGHSCPGVVAFH